MFYFKTNPSIAYCKGTPSSYTNIHGCPLSTKFAFRAEQTRRAPCAFLLCSSGDKYELCAGKVCSYAYLQSLHTHHDTFFAAMKSPQSALDRRNRSISGAYSPQVSLVAGLGGSVTKSARRCFGLGKKLTLNSYPVPLGQRGSSYSTS